jgi:hypothetical protein
MHTGICHKTENMLVHVIDRDKKEVLECLCDNDHICFISDNISQLNRIPHASGVKKSGTIIFIFACSQNLMQISYKSQDKLPNVDRSLTHAVCLHT